MQRGGNEGSFFAARPRSPLECRESLVSTGMLRGSQESLEVEVARLAGLAPRDQLGGRGRR